MSSYILIDRTVNDNIEWSELVRACAIPGDIFEIHCWQDESEAVKIALRFGRKITSTWRDGTVIIGTVTRDFIESLTAIPKPADNGAYNKMTPFFTIRFGNTLSSEHYGSELIISRIPEGRKETVDRILRRMESSAVIHRNIRCH